MLKDREEDRERNKYINNEITKKQILGPSITDINPVSPAPESPPLEG